MPTTANGNGTVRTKRLQIGSDEAVVPHETMELISSYGWNSPAYLGHGCWAAINQIRPDVAKDLVEHRMAPNRKKKKAQIDLISRELRRNRYYLTNQGLGFTRQGLLFDGQNRCYASIEANRSFHAICIFNLSDESASVVDAGVKRSLLDVGSIAGVDMNSRMAATARNVAFGIEKRKLTANEFIHVYNVVQPAVCAVHKHFPHNIRRITRAGMLGAIGRAWYHEDANRLSQFCEIIRAGHCSDDNDVAAVRLLRKMPDIANGGRGNDEAFKKTLYAITKFVAREPIRRLVEAPADTYALPDSIADNIQSY